MGDEDLYTGDIRNYYYIPRTIISANDHPGLICSSGSFPDGKAQRRESRRRAIRRRKGRV